MQPEKVGNYTYQEILSQPDVWASALERIDKSKKDLKAFFDQGQFESVYFTGCGSTYYLSIAAAAALQKQVGIPSRGLPGSEVWLNSELHIQKKKSLLVVVSRSGETTETIRAAEVFRRETGGSVVTLTCYPGMPLATAGDVNLIFTEAQEQSVAQTRAFSTLYLATIALAGIWSGNDASYTQMFEIPAAARILFESSLSLASRFGSDPNLDRFYFLGSGLRYGLACEISLKMKEMSLTHSEPFHFLEFRHGPKSMVNSNALVFGLVSEKHHGEEIAVLNEMKALGGNTLSIAEHDADIQLKSGLHEDFRNILYLPFGQMLAFERAVSKGLNPDQPTNLTTVVRL